jgi:hypothetical protein
MDQFRVLLELAVEHGLGIFLSVFMAFSFIVLGKRIITGHETHARDLIDIIKEREEGVVDNLSDVNSMITVQAAALQDANRRLQDLSDKIDKLSDKQDKINKFLDE